MSAFTDFVINDGNGPTGHGPVGTVLEGVRFDEGLLRPFFGSDGRRYATIKTGRMVYNNKEGKYYSVKETKRIEEWEAMGIRSPVFNDTVLRKDQWIELDRAAVEAVHLPTQAWNTLARRVPFGNFNAWAKLTLEYEARSSFGEAIEDMDAITDGRADQPLYSLRSIPLPVTHSSFWYSDRRLAVARSDGTPLDTMSAEEGGRVIGERVEAVTIGTATGITYGPNSVSDTRYTGTSKVYGMTTYPFRTTKTDLTTPTGSNPEAVKQDLIEMRETMYANGYKGPFVVFHTPSYDAWLDDDYFRSGANTGPSPTLRDRIGKISNIQELVRLDHWTTGGTYQMVMIQMTKQVCRAIIGMRPRVVQWPSRGGFQRNFKILAILVPQFLHEYDGDSGILHATTS